MTDTSCSDTVEHHTPSFSAALNIDLTERAIPSLTGLDDSEIAVPWSASINTRLEETVRATELMVSSRISRDLLVKAKSKSDLDFLDSENLPAKARNPVASCVDETNSAVSRWSNIGRTRNSNGIGVGLLVLLPRS